jgi:hypothetical protein
MQRQTTLVTDARRDRRVNLGFGCTSPFVSRQRTLSQNSVPFVFEKLQLRLVGQ